MELRKTIRKKKSYVTAVVTATERWMLPKN